MSDEEIILVFQDLSGRLLYGVIVDYKEGKYDFRDWKISTLHALAYSQSGSLIRTDSDGWIEYEEYEGCGMSTGSRTFKIGQHKPYLRSLSSMTERERETLRTIDDYLQIDIANNEVYGGYKTFDYLNSIHVDYRGLIPKGLALEAPKGMYKVEE